MTFDPSSVEDLSELSGVVTLFVVDRNVKGVNRNVSVQLPCDPPSLVVCPPSYLRSQKVFCGWVSSFQGFDKFMCITY